MLGFSPLASAPLSDDGIVVVSSSITLVGKASQVIHNDVEGVNSSNKSITTVSSVTDVNDLQVNLTKSITTVSSVTDVNDLQVNLTKSLTTVSSVTGVNDVVGGITTSLTTVSSITDVNDVEGVNNSTKLVSSISSQVTQGSPFTTVDVFLSTTSATGQVRTPQIGPSEHLVSVSVTGDVTRPLLVASSNESLVNVSSSATVNGLVTLVETTLSGVSSSVDVNDLPFVGVPVNATVNLDYSVKPNLYYSGIPSSVYAYGGSVDSNGVTYTSSTQYQSQGVGADFYFKVASNYSGGTQYFFQADGNKTGWSYQRAYGTLTSTSGIRGYVRLGNQLGRNAAASVSVYLPNSGTFSPNTWYRGRIFNSGQRVYAQIYSASGSLLASNSQLMTISYGSYQTNSYQFFLDEFVVGDQDGSFGSAFTGQITDFSIGDIVYNIVRSRVLHQRTTPTWAATNSFTNNATAADTLVFDSPFNSSHLVTTSGSANAVATLVTSNVTAFPTGVSSSAQAQPLEETLVSSSATLDSTSSVAVLRTVTQTHSSNKTLPSADFTSSVNDVDKSVSSSVILDTTNSQASVTDLVSLTTDVLTGVSSSVTFNNLSVNLSTSLTTVSSAAQVSDLVVDIDEIIPPSLSVSSQVSVGQVNAGGGTTLSSINSSSEINTLEVVVSTLINGVSSSASVNSVTPVSNSLVTVDSVTSTSTFNQVSVSIDDVANLTGVEANTAVQFGGVESQEAILRKVTTPCQVGTLTINVGVTLPSTSSTFNASDQVKGVINVSVQLSTLPLITVSRGSITLSTDGFNFEEFKNAYDRARTVYISRAA